VNNPLISVVIPMHNRKNTIGYCLDSVLNQSYKNLEIILVDDCSTDDTVDFVRNNYADERICVIQLTKNNGAQHARNAGIKKAKGEWIAFLDSDDEWLSQKIKQQVEILEKNTFNQYLTIHSNAILFNHIKNIKHETKLEISGGKKEDIHKEFLKKGSILFPAILTSKKALEQINYLDEKIPSYQEWDTAIRLSKICDFIFMKEPTFI
jgi:glycosyltransferase involved in cell wall biosynthesis